MDVNDIMNVMVHSIANELLDRAAATSEEFAYLWEKTPVGEEIKGYTSLSNFTCPICGVMDLQPLRRKWLFFKYGKPIAGFACQNRDCSAKGIVIPPELVLSNFNAMIEIRNAREQETGDKSGKER